MKKVATIWLDGCSGCHMSFLDMDMRLVDIASKCQIVYSPYMDTKEYPQDVDIALIEGSISTQDDLKKIKHIRANTKTIIAFGDCAISGNISALKNTVGSQEVLSRAYIELSCNSVVPSHTIPRLLDRVSPIHEIVDVEYYLQGCPPPSDAIYAILLSLIQDKIPDISSLTRFGK